MSTNMLSILDAPTSTINHRYHFGNHSWVLLKGHQRIPSSSSSQAADSASASSILMVGLKQFAAKFMDIPERL